MKTNRIWLILFCVMMLSALSPCAQEHPNFWWSTTDGDTTYNFHPAGVMDRADGVALDSVTLSDGFTVAVVYRVLTDTTEQRVWALESQGIVLGGLSTHSILGRNSEIQYSDHTQTGPLVNILSQTLPQGSERPERCLLKVGGYDSAACAIKVPEVMYYERKMTKEEMGRVQSYLAMKYGVTLDAADYVDGRGEVLWSCWQNRQYHNRLTAIGRDRAYGLHQLRSRSEVDGSLLTLSTDSLPDDTYIIIGDNGGGTSFVLDSVTGITVMGRRWRVESRLAAGTEQTVRVELDRRALSGKRLPELVIGEEVYAPSRMGDTVLVYDGVTIPRGTSEMLFVEPAESAETMMAMPGHGEEEAGSEERRGRPGTSAVSMDVYPNPSLGHYTVVVRGSESMKVKIYNTLGVVVREESDSGKSEYVIEGTLPAGNMYYVDVTTDEGTQTVKLVVK